MKDSSAWQTMYFLLKSQKITKKFHYLKIISFPSSELKKKKNQTFCLEEKMNFHSYYLNNTFYWLREGGSFAGRSYNFFIMFNF